MNIKIYHIKRDGTKVDISNIRVSLSISGSLSEVARTLNLSIYCRDYKDIQLGEIIEFNDCEYHIFKRDIDSDGLQMDLTCFDKLIYLKKNQASYNYKGVTAEDITRNICNDYNIKIKYIEPTGVKIKRIFRGVDLYSIIQTSYSLASEKTNDKYYMYYNDGLTIKKAFVNETIELEEGRNIIKVTHSEDIQNMVNAVIIYNENQKKINEVKQDSWIEKYGKLSISVEKNKDGEKEDYKAKLKDIQKTLTCECLGNFELKSGNAVKITEKDTNITGLFFITSDTHNIADGLHTTTLELSFEKLMDYQSAGEEKTK